MTRACISTPAPPLTATGNSTKPPSSSTPRLASPDLKLQGLAYYNEGNSLYLSRRAEARLRSSARKPGRKRSRITRAAMKLNPQDADAKFNYEFVKKRLEELKQQQQQQQQSQQDKTRTKSRIRTSNSSKAKPAEAEAGPAAAAGPAATTASRPSKTRSRIPRSSNRPTSRRRSNSRLPSSPISRKKNSSRRKSRTRQPKEKSDEKEQQAEAAQAMAQMTPEQAKQLLDAQKVERANASAQGPRQTSGPQSPY